MTLLDVEAEEGNEDARDCFEYLNKKIIQYQKISKKRERKKYLKSKESL